MKDRFGGSEKLVAMVEAVERKSMASLTTPKAKKRGQLWGTNQLLLSWWFGFVIWWLRRAFPFSLYKNQGSNPNPNH